MISYGKNDNHADPVGIIIAVGVIVLTVDFLIMLLIDWLQPTFNSLGPVFRALKL